MKSYTDLPQSKKLAEILPLESAKELKKIEQKYIPKHKVGDTIYYNSFGELKSMVVTNVVIDSTDNPMYEDKEGNAVFEKDLIEQKPAEWSEEDKKMFVNIKACLRNANEDYSREVDWLKSIKPQPKNEWSEEDEKMIGRVRGIIEAYAFSQSAVDVNGDLCEKKFIDVDIWLKSIKDRVYPKQEWKQENTDDLTDFENAMMHIGESFFGKNAGLDPNDIDAIKEQANTLLGLVPSKEWSEEDEEIINGITSYLCTHDSCELDGFNKWYDFLKYLKERYTWKPSDEQMHYLNWIANIKLGDSVVEQEVSKHLNELYKDLKKLKGE